MPLMNYIIFDVSCNVDNHCGDAMDGPKLLKIVIILLPLDVMKF